LASLSFVADARALICYHGLGGLRMTDAGRGVMEDGDVFVSPITVWEIARKAALGKLMAPMPKDYVGDFASWLNDAGYRVLPLSWADCAQANQLPDLHKDPMDRLLIASALANDVTIVTNDRVIAQYGVPTVW
jgi:PIN domain nuclease of toxin-antitoxin system